MTSHFVKNSKQVIVNDISVIVDNSVEIGDFFTISPYFVKKFVSGFQCIFEGERFQKRKNTYLVNRKWQKIDQISINPVNLTRFI